VAKIRLDRLLVERGLAGTREKAQGMILAGEVYVDGRRADKPGVSLPAEAPIEIRRSRPERVGRAGGKLEGALEAFQLDATGRSALDIGASIGGFTETLLRRGAARVVALDVGRGQLHESLRADPRVTPLEGLNARRLEPSDLPPGALPLDLIVCDVSFISLKLILPAIARVLPRGDAVVLVKPQFEAGRGQVGRGGILRNPVARESAVRAVVRAAVDNAFSVVAACASPLPGAEGNREIFLRLASGGPAELMPGFEESLTRALREAASADAPEPSRR
jgi:23S rRNA (cytidine1920-2'-O)/16S rRNA (cytidine1409-2'-O)-methyltransferase